MTISQACQDAILEYGVLMNGDKPAAFDLLNQPVIRIALVEDGVESISLGDDIKDYMQRDLFMEGTAEFPEGSEDAIRRAFEYWYEGKIEFVTADENPDIHLIAFADGDDGGWGSYPVNDHPVDPEDPERYKGYEDRVIAINMDFVRDRMDYRRSTLTSELESLETLVRHEVTHTAGIDHPFVVMGVANEREPGVCSTQDEAGYLLEAVESNKGITSGISTADVESTLDTALRDKVRGTPQPQNNTPMKP